jgi:hypothetical protein
MSPQNLTNGDTKKQESINNPQKQLENDQDIYTQFLSFPETSLGVSEDILNVLNSSPTKQKFDLQYENYLNPNYMDSNVSSMFIPSDTFTLPLGPNTNTSHSTDSKSRTTALTDFTVKSIQDRSLSGSVNTQNKRKNDTDIPSELALKRKKQNEAARRCRDKKLLILESLKGRVKELEEENFNLKVRIGVLEREKEDANGKITQLLTKLRTLTT